MGSVTGVDVNAFNALATDTQTAISNVNTKVDSTTDLTSDTTKNTFSVGSALFDQLKTAGLAEKTSAGSGSANITFKTMANVNTAALNKPPSDISLSSTSIAENASSLLVGTLTTTDTDQGSGVAFNYSLGEITGEDYGSISINQKLEYLRNWHWMWSKFYFNKKHYGFFVAIKNVFSNFVSALIKYFFYLIIFKKKKRKIYEMRIKGIINATIGKKSWFRV